MVVFLAGEFDLLWPLAVQNYKYARQEGKQEG